LIDRPSNRPSILDEPLSLREKEVEANDSGGLEGPERIGERYDMTLFYFVDNSKIRWSSVVRADMADMNA